MFIINGEINIMPKKESGNKMSTLGSKAMRTPGKITRKEIQRLGGSVVGQDETKGRRKK